MKKNETPAYRSGNDELDKIARRHKRLPHSALHGEPMTAIRSKSLRKQSWAVALFVVCMLFLDQGVKYLVKTHMALGEQIVLTHWFSIYFVENPGMAYGIELGSKLFLSIFRIVAMGLLAYFIVYLLRQRRFPTGFLLTLSLVFAGGIGNIIDCAFYGLLFSESSYMGPVAEFLPSAGGYAPFLHGKVVDMLYFPLIDTYLPQWIPFVGGRHFTFFDPVFNIADSCITVGVLMLLLFYVRSLGMAMDTIGKKKSISVK